jgi:methyl-accepting chemotaxis protein
VDYQQFWATLRSGQYLAAGLASGQGWQGSWIEVRNPILDANGRPFKVVKFATDITDQSNCWAI